MHAIYVQFCVFALVSFGFASEQSITSMDTLTLTWRTLPLDPLLPAAIRMTLSTNLSEKSGAMWVGLGFGYDNFKMDGHKKALIMGIRSLSECSLQYVFLDSDHSVTFIKEVVEDPWGIKPLCFVSSTGTAQATFVVGGNSSIDVPQIDPMYFMFAFGENPEITNHGKNWDYKKLSLFTNSPDILPIDPWLLTHGIVYIIVFSILMPLTSFLILYNRDKFFVIHKILGVIIIALLILGWAVLSVSAAEVADGAVFAPFDSSDVALTHSPTGIAAKYVALAVCISGIIVATLRMPKRIHFAVRVGHGVGGGIVSIFGPLVVWNGWVRLFPSDWTPLIATPMVWLSVTMGLLVLWVILRMTARGKPQPVVEDDLEQCSKQNSPNLYFYYKGALIRPNPAWVHPGGALADHAGLDITKEFDRFHSSSALAQLLEMRESEDTSTLDGLSFDEEKPIMSTLVSVTTVNASKKSPVLQFSIKRNSLMITVGSKVRIVLKSVARTYTVASVDDETFCLYIKIYSNGALTSLLKNLHAGDSISFIVGPKHNSIFSEQPVVLLAGGTGIVPMLQYLDRANIHLLWWLHDEEDLFLMDIVSKLQKVSIHFTSTQGRIERSHVQHLLSSFIVMSGPPGFIKAAKLAAQGAPNVLSLD